MRGVRNWIGETQQSLLAFLPPFPLATGVDQSNPNPPGPVVAWKDYPFPQHEGLLVTSFVCHLLRFPRLEVFSLSFTPPCSSFGREVHRMWQSHSCLHLFRKGKIEMILFPLASAYLVGSLPEPHCCLSPPLLLLCSAHSDLPPAALSPLVPENLDVQGMNAISPLSLYSHFCGVNEPSDNRKEAIRNPLKKYRGYLKQFGAKIPAGLSKTPPSPTHAGLSIGFTAFCLRQELVCSRTAPSPGR